MAALEALAVAATLPATVAEIGGLEFYGWAFSGFMLAEIVGINVAGRVADARGLAPPFGAGICLFGAGLLVAGAAPSMTVLVAGRIVQGLGAGAIAALSYAAIAIAYPPEAKPRMLALQSTAWVAPSLVGPGLAGVVADHVGWRWVFLGLAPLAFATAFMVVPALRRVARRPAKGAAGARHTVAAVSLAVSGGVALAAFQAPQPLVALGVGGAALAVALRSLRPLLPSGTLWAKAGLPAAIAVMGLLSAAFFGAEIFVPLALTEVRGQAAALAGLVLTASSLTWTAGAILQERLAPKRSRRAMTTVGLASMAVGIALTGSLLSDAVAPWLGIPFWGIAGFGIGLAYTTIALVVLEATPPGREGTSAAALQLGNVLGTAVGTGAGGAVVATLAAGGGAMRGAIAVVGALALALNALALLAATRLPGRPAQPRRL